jgi:PAS domain S-box-containing protein
MDQNKKNQGLQKKIEDLENALKQQKKILKALDESENRYRTIFDNANDGIILHDPKGKIIDVNQSMFKRLGYSKKEMLKMSLNDLVTPEFEEKISARINKLKEEGIAVFESGDKRKDGTYMHVEVSARLIDYNGRQIIQSIVRDINDRKMAEELISSTLKEKEILLGEIQKRIKFKNKVFSRTMELLSHESNLEDMLTSLAAARLRLESMAFIEDKLYRSLNFSRINFSDIVKSLTTYLYSLLRVGIKKIQIKRNIHEIYLDIHRVVPCTLIISELLTNSLQHSFPDDRDGEIIIQLIANKGGDYHLTIKDNGIGLPDQFNHTEANTIGMSLVRDLVAELDGKITRSNGKYTAFIINFK